MALREAVYRWCCCRKVPRNTDRKASFIVRQEGSEMISSTLTPSDFKFEESRFIHISDRKKV